MLYNFKLFTIVVYVSKDPYKNFTNFFQFIFNLARLEIYIL